LVGNYKEFGNIKPILAEIVLWIVWNVPRIVGKVACCAGIRVIAPTVKWSENESRNYKKTVKIG
jgi:hypothetical protein